MNSRPNIEVPLCIPCLMMLFMGCTLLISSDEALDNPFI
jgi:hypothetical protein